MSTKNLRLWRRFDEGQAIESLDGQGDYFIPDITYRESHDRVLVIDQLLDWAEEREEPRYPRKVVTAVAEVALQRHDPQAALEVLLTYGLVRRGRKQLDGEDGVFMSQELERVFRSLRGERCEPGVLATLEAVRQVAKTAPPR